MASRIEGPLFHHGEGRAGAYVPPPGFHESDIQPVSLVEKSEDYRIATSAETMALMGIDPLRMHIVPVGKNQPKLVSHFTEGVIEAALNQGGEVLDQPTGVNSVVFPRSFKADSDGIMGYRQAFREGATGLAISSIPEPLPHKDMLIRTREFLGRAGSQYGLIAVGDERSTNVKGAYIVSLEGARTYVPLEKNSDESEFYEQLGQRAMRLSGGRHVTDHAQDKTMSRERWEENKFRDAIAQAGRDLRALDLLPHENIDSYKLSLVKKAKVKLFLGVSGMSVGQMSALDEEIFWITETGINKGELPREGVIPVRGLNIQLHENEMRILGATTWRPEGERYHKPSVETVDNWMLYAASAGLKSGALKSADLRSFKDFIINQDAVVEALMTSGSDFLSTDHVHFWPDLTTVDPKLYNVKHVNSKLVPGRAFHSSCGTEPLSLSTGEAALAGMVEDQELGLERDQIVLMPNHGIQLVSRKDPRETIEKLREAMLNGMRFTQVPSR